MSVCPYCGSEDIQVIRDSKIEWTRAIVGHVIYGPVGAALGSVTGKSRFANYCLDCGKHWDQSGLLEEIKTMKKYIPCNLNLKLDNHRMALAIFSQKNQQFNKKFQTAKANQAIKYNSQWTKAELISVLTLLGGLALAFVAFGIGFRFFGSSGGVILAALVMFIVFAILVFFSGNAGNKKRAAMKSKASNDWEERYWMQVREEISELIS